MSWFSQDPNSGSLLWLDLSDVPGVWVPGGLAVEGELAALQARVDDAEGGGGEVRGHYQLRAGGED